MRVHEQPTEGGKSLFLSQLKVLHAFLLDTTNCVKAPATRCVEQEQRGDLHGRTAAAGILESYLGGLEQLYVHRLVAVPDAFLEYLSMARGLRLVGLQRCEGISMGAVVSTLESSGFRRLKQHTLPDPECRAFASSISRGGVAGRFVVLKRDEPCLPLVEKEAQHTATLQ